MATLARRPVDSWLAQPRRGGVADDHQHRPLHGVLALHLRHVPARGSQEGSHLTVNPAQRPQVAEAYAAMVERRAIEVLLQP